MRVFLFWLKSVFIIFMICWAFVKGNSGWGGVIEVTCVTCIVSVISIFVHIVLVDTRDTITFLRTLLVIFHLACTLAAVLSFFANWRVVEETMVPNAVLWAYWKNYIYWPIGISLLGGVALMFFDLPVSEEVAEGSVLT